MRLRRLWHFLLAANIAMSLLHGPSMAMAEGVKAAAHLSPHHQHAHHMSAGPSTTDDRAAPGGGDDHSANALPGCPLASVSAINPVVVLEAVCGDGAMVHPQPVRPLRSFDLSRSDPPPRFTA